MSEWAELQRKTRQRGFLIISFQRLEKRLWQGHNSSGWASPCPCTLGTTRIPVTQAAAPPSHSTLTEEELPQAKKKKKKSCIYAHRVASVVSNSLQPCRLWPARLLCQGVLQARIVEHIAQYWYHILLEHYISCCPSHQLPWVPGAARTPVTQATVPPPHLALTGQTQVLQGSLRSKPPWMTHMQRWK